MIVEIVNFGNENDKKFVEYHVSDLTSNQMKFLDDNLNEDTCVDEDILKIKMYFDEKLYPFQSEAAKYRQDDFIAREEIEMNVFLSSFLEDM